MNSFNTNAHDFRSSERKCFSFAGCLVFVLLMSQASCRPSETDIDNDNDSDSDNNSNKALTYNDKDYIDPDDIDWKNFAADVETTPKVHPIIFYKEDIVSEDYDPNKDENKTNQDHQSRKETKPYHRRKYKEISRHHRHRNQTESYRYIKPEKVYFDINPIEHHQDSRKEASNENDNKFNDNDIHVEVISLFDDNDSNLNDEAPSKHLLSKTPKKFNHRQRRDVSNEESVELRFRHKRNPFYRRVTSYANQLPVYRGTSYQPQMAIYPVKSPYYYNAYSPINGINIRKVTPKPNETPSTIGTRFDGDDDRPVWPLENVPMRPAVTRTTTSRPMPPRRTPPPIIQYGDEDYVPETPDNRIINTPQQAVSSVASQAFQPQMRPVLTTTRPPVTTTSAPAPASRGISSCIWAISSCCTSNQKVRYGCFERLGCSGAFWDLNPCADNIFQIAVQAADEYLQ